MQNNTGWFAMAAAMLVGLIGAAAILAPAIQQIRASERYVTVRGVAERDVTADLALWPLKVRIAGDNLAIASQSADAARAKVLGFLADNGIGTNEVVGQTVRVFDRQANEYGRASDGLRYMVEHAIVIRSTEVGKIQKVSQMTDKLVAAGIVLSAQGGDSGMPQFLFTRLNEIKPAMLAEATKAAREAAGQFAADSGSRVASIRKASQGLFTIADRDVSAAGEGERGMAIASDPNKRVRVVVTVDYLLDD